VKGDDVTSANLALIGGNVLTMNPSQPRAEAVAVKGNRIAKVGTNEEINQLVGAKTKIIHLNGKTVVPGFIDTHIHVADFAKLLKWVDLNDVKSIKELQSRLKEHAQKTPRGRWIIGRGWNHARLQEKRLPSLSDLDSASPNNPVIMYHESALMCVVNSKALELAGVTKHTRAPSGGTIDKDAETGEVTGVLRDAATDLVWKVIPEPSADELLEATGLAFTKVMEAGVTSVHWIILSAIELSVIRKLLAQKKLPISVYLIVPVNLLDSVLNSDLPSFSAGKLKVGGVMIFADGYLAARTAALLQPYSDETSISGELLCGQEKMNAAATKTLRAGLQLVIHAVGDKAVDAALTTIERVSSEAIGKGVSCRVEQAAVLNEGLIKRLKTQKVIVSVQPCVVASEFSVWSATEHLGAERAKWLFPLNTLIKEGVKVVGGSDCPMEPLNPLLGIQAAVTRRFFPEEQITIDEALRMYTVDAAYSSGEENIKGSVETGKLADLTVLSCDPCKVPPNEIENITVEMTIASGKIVYPKH
jgi:predicted amidohydrolase YtcJ